MAWHHVAQRGAAGVVGASVYGLLQWRATRLSPEQQSILRNEVLVARGSAKERSYDREIETETDRLLAERLKDSPVDKVNVPEVRQQLREQVKAGYQVVPPATYRRWEIDLGSAKHYLANQPLHLRVKFNTANNSSSGTFRAYWQVGVPQQTKLWRNEEPMSLAPDTFHEFEIPPEPF